MWDSFHSHLTEKVKEKCRSMNTTVAVIPGGLTSMLQPLDVCLNKPFKDRLRQKWIEWMSTKDKSLTMARNLKKVDVQMIAQRVKDMWLDDVNFQVEQLIKEKSWTEDQINIHSKLNNVSIKKISSNATGYVLAQLHILVHFIYFYTQIYLI